jgi:hypothetical protein
VVLQIILVFAMIGVLGLLLRWAFARDKRAPQWPATQPAQTLPPDTLPADTRPPETLPADTFPADTLPSDTRPADTRSTSAASAAAGFAGDPEPGAAEGQAVDATLEREDYGLLAEAATASTGDEAERIKARLGAVGIRATTTVGRDGRHRVLVFASEIHRARRVAGGSSS